MIEDLMQNAIDSITKYPKRYYATEDKLIHKVGYTVALGMMAIGVAETLHSLQYIRKGQSSTVGMLLGPATAFCGSTVAGLYLMEADVIGSY
jgi:succinate-acetate transporter protein